MTLMGNLGAVVAVVTEFVLVPVIPHKKVRAHTHVLCPLSAV